MLKKICIMLASTLMIAGVGAFLVVATFGVGSPRTFNAQLSGEEIAQDPYGFTPTPTPADQAPVFTTFPKGTVYPGVALSFQVAATDPDGDPVTISWSRLPLAPVKVTCTASGNGGTTPVVSCSLAPSSSIDTTDDIVFTAADGRGGVSTHTVTVGPAYYVAMGDSYASGEGAPPFDAGTDVTKDTRRAPQNTCHRSSASWNFGLEATTPYVMEAFIACSGAQSPQVTTQAQFANQPVQVTSLGNVAHQPSMVSLSIGGNDVDFHDVVVDCLDNRILGQCGAQIRRSLAFARSAAFSQMMMDDMQKIHLAAPAAKIELVGYPNVMSTSSRALLLCPWLTSAAQQNIIDLITGLATVQATIAGQLPPSWNVHYINTLGAFQGHEMCTPRAYVNSLSAAAADIGIVSAWKNETAHPNFAGQQAMLNVVSAAINSQS